MATEKKSVLFIGSRNHRRSRAAEIVFNAAASKMGLAWTAESRGLDAKAPTKKEGPIDARLAKGLQLRGIRQEDFTRNPAQLAADDLTAATIVVALDRSEHASPLHERFPTQAARVEYWQIPTDPDPLPAIEREVANLVARLLGGRASEETPAAEPDSRPKRGAIVRVGRETKGRKGKGVTTISDVPLEGDRLQELTTLLKTKCGTGGTVKGGVIEIQGDQRDRLSAELEKLGYRVKRVGG